MTRRGVAYKESAVGANPEPGSLFCDCRTWYLRLAGGMNKGFGFLQNLRHQVR